MTEPAISVEGLTKSFKDHDVLTGVSFNVARGTIFALLGSNGAGKTTIINILTTLIHADSGRVSVGGFDVAHAAKSVRRRISLTGQFAAVDDVLSARENLELIGELRHVSDPRQTATTLLANFDLTDAADRRVATFSGGMRRRLDIAMGLIGSPEIIFLDEPTNGLDPQSRLQMWATIRALARGGTTVFLTTQYLEEADELADTIAVLHLGRIIAVGTAEELKGLVPSGHVRLSFADDVQLDAAVATLASEFDVIDRHLLTITVATGGSATRIADLFVRLRDAQIEPSDFAQQAPTLDDAFLALTRSK